MRPRCKRLPFVALYKKPLINGVQRQLISGSLPLLYYKIFLFTPLTIQLQNLFSGKDDSIGRTHDGLYKSTGTIFSPEGTLGGQTLGVYISKRDEDSKLSITRKMR